MDRPVSEELRALILDLYSNGRCDAATIHRYLTKNGEQTSLAAIEVVIVTRRYRDK